MALSPLCLCRLADVDAGTNNIDHPLASASTEQQRIHSNVESHTTDIIIEVEDAATTRHITPKPLEVLANINPALPFSPSNAIMGPSGVIDPSLTTAVAATSDSPQPFAAHSAASNVDAEAATVGSDSSEMDSAVDSEPMESGYCTTLLNISFAKIHDIEPSDLIQNDEVNENAERANNQAVTFNIAVEKAETGLWLVFFCDACRLNDRQRFG